MSFWDPTLSYATGSIVIQDNRYYISNSFVPSGIKPVTSTSRYVQDLPPPLQEYDLALPVTSQYGTNDYRKGLLDYNKLMNLVKDILVKFLPRLVMLQAM